MENKIERLKKIFLEYAKQDICVAFSGGVDSSVVLVMACEAAKTTGKKVYALTMDTVLHPKADLEAAVSVLKKTDAIHKILTLDELADEEMRYNPVNRCYLCKKQLFLKMQEYGKSVNAPLLLEGSNQDDLGVYRPGLAAIRELKVRSPLAECGITKAEVRKLAHTYGIPVADRPSTPCLATRLPYGAEIDLKLLERIGAAEEKLRDVFEKGNIRIRVHGNILRLELDQENMLLLFERKKEVMDILKTVKCDYITLDLDGFRSGSMDIFAKK